MKIAVFGSYNGTSVGDTAILLGLLSSLNRIYSDRVEVYVLVMSPLDIKKESAFLHLNLKIHEVVITEFDKSANFAQQLIIFGKKLLNKIWIKKALKICRVKKIFQKVDYVLIGGGNLLMDLYKDSPTLLSTICQIADMYNIPYSFISVGAGPIETVYAKNIYKELLQRAKHIYVRDQNSLYLLKKLYPEFTVLQMPDLALALPKCINSKKDRSYLLVNVASVYGKNWPVEDDNKFNHYISNIVEVTNAIIQMDHFVKVKVFYSNYPLDRYGGKTYVERLKKLNIDVEEIDEKLTVNDIITLATKTKLTLVTRLHAGIMASLGNSKVAAVAYQPKVSDVLTESDITKCIFTDNFSNKEEVLECIEKIINNEGAIYNADSSLYWKHIDRTINNILSKHTI